MKSLTEDTAPPPPASSSSSSSKPNGFKVPTQLTAIGFEVDEMSASKVSGHLLITPMCCQQYKVLHGGISSVISVSLAGIGAHIASGFKRVSGVQLSVNYLKSATLGDLVLAEATPVNIGKSIQVWNVCLWKSHPYKPEIKAQIASSQVTLFNMSEAKGATSEHSAKYLQLSAKL